MEIFSCLIMFIINNFNDSRIEYIQHHENRGLAVRRAESATLAKGDFVAILDSDDIWIDEKKIAIQVAYMMAHLDCSIVGSFIKIIDKNGVVLGSRRFCIVDSKIRKNSGCSRYINRRRYSGNEKLKKLSSE